MKPPKPELKKSTARVLYISSIPEDERARLAGYAGAVGRPISWIVRDAVRLYIAAAEESGLRPVQKLDAHKAGKTSALKRGRPFRDNPNV